MRTREWLDVSRRWVMGLSSTLLFACPPDEAGYRRAAEAWYDASVAQDVSAPRDAWVPRDPTVGQDPRFVRDAGHALDAHFAPDTGTDPDATTADDAALAQDAGPIVSARGTLVDARDGQRYATVTLGARTWMAQSLNYGPQQLGIEANPLPTDDAKVEKYCMADDPEQCRKAGGVYSWPEALALPAACVKKLCAEQIARVHQGICPLGWHVPSHEEWTELALYLARRMGLLTRDENSAWPFVTAALKSAELWAPGAAGTNESGFGALPTSDWVDVEVDGGIIKGAFFHSTEELAEEAAGGPGLFAARGDYASFGKDLITSLRCVEDR